MKMDAASLGRGLASSQATSAGLALNAGNSATTNAGTPLQHSLASNSVMNNGFNTAISGNNSAGQMYGNIAGIQQSANASNNAGMAALGNIAGQLWKISDENAKENIKPVSDKKSLSMVDKIASMLPTSASLADFTKKKMVSANDELLSSGLANQAGKTIVERKQKMQQMLDDAEVSSDVNAKENIMPISDKRARSAVENIGNNVKQWDYKPGMGDGGTHIGPMAQTVNKYLGEKAAPGGNAIDLISMNGVSMKSIAALSRKVDKLTSQVEGLKS
jgi:hypothetical protein